MVTAQRRAASTALAVARAMLRPASVIWPPARGPQPKVLVALAGTLLLGLVLTPAALVGGQEALSPDVRLVPFQLALPSGAALRYLAPKCCSVHEMIGSNARYSEQQVGTALVDLDGRPVAPFDEAPGKAVVFVFATYDCPISNRYAPEVRRLYERFAPHAQFWLVYPDPTIAPAVLRQHGLEYGYPFGALRDLKHELVSRTGVKVTPEVAVFDRARRLVYRGRIDDRVVDFGKVRVVPTRRDLEDVLQRMVAGERIVPSTTDAVGCYISAL